jgi:hypothetical protein
MLVLVTPRGHRLFAEIVPGVQGLAGQVLSTPCLDVAPDNRAQPGVPPTSPRFGANNWSTEPGTNAKQVA